MKLKSLLIVGTFLGGASFAQADEKSFGDGTLPEFLQEYDVNEDGTIDEEERQAIKEARKAAREARRAEIDTDGDGEISQEEREAAREAIRAEIEAKRAEKFAEIAGEDGLLTLEEFAAIPHLEGAPEERVAAMFARLDANEDGSVDLDEFNARLRHHRPRPFVPRPGDGEDRPRPGDGPHPRPGSEDPAAGE
ncbi:MAG: EF-hand domain-containing protein [Verrucomicrobiaceae bacterium]